MYLSIKVVKEGEAAIEFQLEAERSTVRQLREHVSHLNGTPPTHQKILCGGVVVVATAAAAAAAGEGTQEEEVLLSSLSLRSKKLLVMCTKAESVEKVQEAAAESTSYRIRDDLSMSSSRGRQRANTGGGGGGVHQAGDYLFLRIAPLSAAELPRGAQPPPEQAMKLLQQLADDRGIAAVMRKHGWRVRFLTEFAPSLSTGLIGLSSTCLMGYNQNKGEKIALRLRTSDFKGFQRYQDTRCTLLHELAHMQYSEHDSNFWALYQQLLREYDELDWTKSSGHAIDPHAEFYRGDDMEEETDGNLHIVAPLDASQDGLHRLVDPATMAATAAALRAASASASAAASSSSSSSHEHNSSSSTHHHHDTHEYVRTHNSTSPSVASATIADLPARLEQVHSGSETSAATMEDEDTRPVETTCTDCGGASGENEAMVDVAVDGDAAAAGDGDGDGDGSANVDMQEEVSNERVLLAQQQQQRQRESEPITVVDLDAPLAEMMAKLRQALQQVVSSAAPDWKAARVAVDTLAMCVTNIIKHPQEPKFRTLRFGNDGFRVRVGRFTGSREFLRAVGFRYADTNQTTLELPPATEDAALLLLARDIAAEVAACVPVE